MPKVIASAPNAGSRHQRGRRVGSSLAEINVIPLVDVMLVLLIIFMVAAPLINPGQIDLPQVGAKLDPAVAPLEVRVRANGDLAVVDRSRSPDEILVRRAQLLGIVREAQRSNEGQAVVIAGDRGRAWLAARPAAGVRLAHGVGVLLLAAAAWTAFESWRGVA